VEYFWLSRVLLYTLIAYLVVDTAWIFVQPSCVLGGAPALIAHHVATLLFCIIPLTEPRYAWHLSVTLAVEVRAFVMVPFHGQGTPHVDCLLPDALTRAHLLLCRS
jgi:hypothetical protein